MTPTRFVRFPTLYARLLIAALALLVVIGIVQTIAPGPGPHLGPAGHGDAALYQAIADRTAHEGYYTAAIGEQRMRGYPVRPFVTVREPALAQLSASLGPRITVILFRLLALVTLGALILRIRRAIPHWIPAAILATLCCEMISDPAVAVWHEAWAALLVTLSLACRSQRHWAHACLLGLAAVLLRELALPYLVMMLLAALAERRRAEAAGWGAAILLFALALARHATLVARHVLPHDLGSPGWSEFGGWRFILGMVHDTSVMTLLPFWTSAILIPLALLGWAGRTGQFFDRVTITLAAWILPFMAIGRPDNFYWGLMFAMLLPVGLAFAPSAVFDLYRAARGARSLPTRPSVV
jgi:hypothetical protein